MSKKLDSFRKDAARLLKQVLIGERSASDARTEWPKEEGKDRLLDKAFHELYHYEADRDIRDKDEIYASWQKKQIKNIILMLEDED